MGGQVDDKNDDDGSTINCTGNEENKPLTITGQQGRLSTTAAANNYGDSYQRQQQLSTTAIDDGYLRQLSTGAIDDMQGWGLCEEGNGARMAMPRGWLSKRAIDDCNQRRLSMMTRGQ